MAFDIQALTPATLDNFQQIVLQASRDKPVLVDFWADWCAPCKALEPILSQVAAQLADRLSVVKVNADQEAGLAAQFAVRGLPTLMLFSGGRPVGQLVGAQPAERILALVSPHLTSAAENLVRQAEACREQGEVQKAQLLLREALAAEPDNSAAIRAPIPLRAAAGDPLGAGALHAQLSRTDRESSWGVALATLIELAELAGHAPERSNLENALQQNPGDSKARAQLAARHAMAGRYREAMDQLLELVRRDKPFNDGLGRRALLAVFELAGDHGPLAAEYRRKMAAALH
jgi:putative thioredoxin